MQDIRRPTYESTVFVDESINSVMTIFLLQFWSGNG